MSDERPWSVLGTTTTGTTRDEQADWEREVATRRRERRMLLWLVVVVLLVVAAVYAAGGPGPRDRLPRGTTVAGVDVGGLGPRGAEQRLLRRAAATRLDAPVGCEVARPGVRDRPGRGRSRRRRARPPSPRSRSGGAATPPTCGRASSAATTTRPWWSPSTTCSSRGSSASPTRSGRPTDRGGRARSPPGRRAGLPQQRRDPRRGERGRAVVAGSFLTSERPGRADPRHGRAEGLRACGEHGDAAGRQPGHLGARRLPLRRRTGGRRASGRPARVSCRWRRAAARLVPRLDEEAFARLVEPQVAHRSSATPGTPRSSRAGAGCASCPPSTVAGSTSAADGRHLPHAGDGRRLRTHGDDDACGRCGRR